jgi:23S rRNA pseudouridine2605 synthase
VTVPLERALSKLGLATRSEARALIRQGRVLVDGRIVTEPATPVIPERIHLAIDGRTAPHPARLVVALHKPRGVVVTRTDPDGRKTVYDLLHGLNEHVVPVGRLDYATSGLLLLTNDTRFADWLTDPATAVSRIYLVTVRGRVSAEDARRLMEGVRSGVGRLQARTATVRKASGRESHLIVELVEGKNREVRRLMLAIGHEVTRLRRVQFGGLTVDGLSPAAWRVVDEDELRRAFPAWYASGPGKTQEKKLRRSTSPR